EDGIRGRFLDFVNEGRKVGGRRVVTFEQHHLVPLLQGVGVQSGGDVGGELIVFVDDGNPLDARIGGRQQVQGAGQVGAGRGVGLEDQGVAFRIGAVGGGASGDQDFAVLFGDNGRSVSQAA